MNPKKSRRLALRNLAAVPVGESPPSEFLLFRRGVNDSENGPALFDEEAAALVMEAYGAHGVDRMIDLEHLSIDTESINYDPDARGWFRLELRDDGSLWAVDVKWTPDGQRRLSEKTQRYISPAFMVDPETDRVTRLVNVAITALPATHETPHLVAANILGNMTETIAKRSLTLDEVMAIAKALDLDEGATLDDFLAKIGALKSEEPAAEEAPKEESAEATDPAAAPAPEEDEEKKAATLAVNRLRLLTGRATASESFEDVERWRAAYAEQAEFRKARAAIEAEDRRALVVQLVKLCAETPATAWSDDTAKTPCDRLQAEPLDGLRKRVAALTAARGGKAPEAKTPATNDELGISERELRMCAEKKIDPKTYAAAKAAAGN